MLKYAKSTCALMGLGAFTLFGQVVPAPQAVQTTGMVGIAESQTAQLNLLNPGVLAPALGEICKASVAFVDANGTVLKSTTLTVNPGQSMAFTLRSDTDLSLAIGARREIRATISTPVATPPNATGAAATSAACKLIPTLEMLDTVSGRTLVLLGHVVTIPAVVTPTAAAH